MKAKEKLIRFMKAKALKLVEGGLPDASIYFNEKDIEAICSWKDKEAREVLMALHYFLESEEVEGLRHETCPFCIWTIVKKGDSPIEKGVSSATVDCSICPYARHHGGSCFSNDSDFGVVIDHLEVDDHALLDNETLIGFLESRN